MPIDIEKEFAQLRENYEKDERQASFNALILGESGSGKTFLLRTARKPVHIDSFDPGGTKGLRDLIKKGEVIVDTRYEGEDPLSPFAYQAWKKEFEYRRREGYFNYIGTYVIDSATTWSEAIMNQILKAANIAGKAPRFTHDYVPQKVEIRNKLRQCLDTPCDFILIGHHQLIEDVDDEGKKTMRFRFMTTGQGMVTIPLLFDEVYSMVTRRTSTGVDYQLVTQNDGVHPARSRLAKGGALSPREEPDIKKLLKKAGVSCDDKPLFPTNPKNNIEGGDTTK